MRIKCQECGTIVEIDESEYPIGIEQTIECPLCQNNISFTINDVTSNTADIPPSSPVHKEPRKVKSRLAKTYNQFKSRESTHNTSNEVETIVNTHDADREDTTGDSSYGFFYYLGYYHNYVKWGIIICLICLASYFIYKFAWHSNVQSPNIVDSDSIEEVVDTTAIEEVINESDSIISFLSLMYEDSKYNDYTFLNSHCTQHLLSVLSEAYDYECDNGPCYATWLFRTAAQDSKPESSSESKIISVKDLGDDWYECEFYDSGWRGIKRIKAYLNQNNVMMDMVEAVYDETSEVEPSANNEIVDFKNKMENSEWKTYSKGEFRYPDFFSYTETYVDDVPASVEVFSYESVQLCYWPLIGEWSVYDYPGEGRMVSSTAKIKDITYKHERIGVFSGYTMDGNIYYMKKKISEGDFTSHSSVLVLVYPKDFQNEVVDLINIVNNW